MKLPHDQQPQNQVTIAARTSFTVTVVTLFIRGAFLKPGCVTMQQTVKMGRMRIRMLVEVGKLGKMRKGKCTILF